MCEPRSAASAVARHDFQIRACRNLAQSGLPVLIELPLEEISSCYCPDVRY